MASTTEDTEMKYSTSDLLSSIGASVNECSSVDECKSLERIKDVLIFYQNISNKQHKNSKLDDDAIVQHLDRYKDIINDYHHILLHHLATGNKVKDNANFHVIDAIIHESITCNISQCQNYKRNHRNRGQKKNDDADAPSLNLEHSGDDTAVFYKELLDSIHCYFVHSVDIGFRMQIDDQNSKYDDKRYDSDVTSSATDLYKDEQIAKVREVLAMKKKKLKHVGGANRVQFNKFSTDISNESMQKQQMKVPTDEEANDDEDKKEDDDKEVSVYSFGYQLFYWDFFKKMELFIPKKYDNFEQEILQLLPKSQYARTVTKAKQMLKTNQLRKLQSHEWKNWGIDQGLPIDVEHLMAICFYTDYDELSFKLSESLRKIRSDRSNDDIKKRNMEYREWSRILRETVECFGHTIGEAKISVFYHGVSMIYFDSFIAKFCCPTSTTTQLEVATIFADTNGIILELEKASIGGSLRYFNCSLLSVYGSEDERLFIGGKQPLQFRSIRMIRDNHNYRYFIKALSLFDKIINSQMLYQDEVGAVTKTDYKVVHAMINNQIGDKQSGYPDYIKTCFDTFVTNKSVVKFNLAYMREQYPLFFRVFLDKKHSHYFLNNMDNNLLAFDHICNIFKQAHEIHSIRTDPAQDVFPGQGFMYLDSLLVILDKINKNASCKLKVIRIFGKKDLSDNDLYSNFKTYIADKTGWNLKINDNQLTISRSV
eukprot:278404_1